MLLTCLFKLVNLAIKTITVNEPKTMRFIFSSHLHESYLAGEDRYITVTIQCSSSIDDICFCKYSLQNTEGISEAIGSAKN